MGSRTDRISNEAARRREAQAYIKMLKNNVKILRQEVGSFIADARQIHYTMSIALKDSLMQSKENLIKGNQQKEYAAFLKKCHNENREAAATLHLLLQGNERKRLKDAREVAGQRARVLRANVDKTRGYLQGCAFQRVEMSISMREERARYMQCLVKYNNDRKLENHKFMNEQRMNLLKSLDLG